MKPKARVVRDEMRPEYEFDYSTVVRGKYYLRLLQKGANVVVLDLTWQKPSGILRQ